MVDPRTLPQGTIIQVRYLDWANDPTGDTRKGDVLCKTLFCALWEVKVSEKFGIDVLVATGSSDPDGPHEQGYYAWPLSTVVGVEVIRRPRTPRKRTKKGDQPQGG